MANADDSRATDRAGDRDRMPASRTWFIIAAVFSAAAVVLAIMLLVGLVGDLDDEGHVDVAPADGGELVIAIGRTPGGPTEWSTYVALVDHIARELDRPVAVTYLTDRESAVEVFTLGEADAGLICTGSYLKLSSTGVVEAVAVPITGGATTEEAMLLVRASSDVENLDDLEGRSVAVASKTSVSGAGFLYWLCDQNGVSPEQFFGAIQVYDTQEQSLRALADGDVDATVGCTTEVARYPAGTFRVIDGSVEYALPPFVVATSLDAETARAITDAVLSFGGDEIPADSKVTGFLPVARDDYDVMFLLMEYSPFWHGD